MSRLSDPELARALGIPPGMVAPLRRRGMPCGKLDQARQWLANNGMRARRVLGRPHRR